MTKPRSSGPLEGVRIIDLTRVIMGPFATRIMADMGADVIKIESAEGDSLRTYNPLRNAGMSGAFMHVNRNKRSIVLDLKTDEGRAALDRLIETADVFVHALRPSSVARLGYDYDRVKSLKPDIIYCGAHGFSTKGPYGDKAAYDDAIQACSGIAALFAANGGEPRYVPTVLCDKLAGQAIAYSVIAALFARSNGAGGQSIEVPMFETAIDFNILEHVCGSLFDPPLGPPGYERVLSADRKPYRTADGYACILPYSDKNWRDFLAFVGKPEMAEDKRYALLADRVRHIKDLYKLIAEEAPKKTTEEWMTFCDSVTIPCMPVLSMNDLPQDPHIQAVGLFSPAHHPSEGPYTVLRAPVTFSNSDFQVRHHAPTLGQNTEEILNEIGLTLPTHSQGDTP